MEVRTWRRKRRSFFALSVRMSFLLAFSLQVVFLQSTVSSETTEPGFFPELQKAEEYVPKGQQSPDVVGEGCNEEKDVDIITTYTDSLGNVRMQKARMKDLSTSWVWEKDGDCTWGERKIHLEEDGSHTDREDFEQLKQLPSEHEVFSTIQHQRLKLLQKKRELRTTELLRCSNDSQEEMKTMAIGRAKQFDSTLKRKYSIWRRDDEKSLPDTTLKLMKDQVIMARLYASIANSRKQTSLYQSLMNHIKDNRHAIGEANSDAELPQGAMEQAKSMGRILSLAKDKLYVCTEVVRKLRAMIQITEEAVDSQKKKSTFLTHATSKTIPKPLHCLPLHLTADYYLHHYNNIYELPNTAKLEDPALYHYAVFSDNVLATSVVINSTILNANEPEKHVFHIVTDKLNFAAMKMWFLIYPPSGATVHVENVDDFKWLNSSYSSVLRQLELESLKDYYFKTSDPSTLSVGYDNLKYKNPKYLSILNHLRFYIPELYPKLNKILFLDDDVVVQKDLTPLWSIDMKGMVNGAVETCKKDFHQFKTYLNFSNPNISRKFDPEACGWAFGMNIFDLREWKKRNITWIYHNWQDMNEDRQLWQLGTLPPALLTFYNLTYVLDRSWHLLGLGYNARIDTSKIERAAVIHYNGNYKPWLELAMKKYRKYWTKYVMLDNLYLQDCHIYESF